MGLAEYEALRECRPRRMRELVAVAVAEHDPAIIILDTGVLQPHVYQGRASVGRNFSDSELERHCDFFTHLITERDVFVPESVGDGEAKGYLDYLEQQTLPAAQRFLGHFKRRMVRARIDRQQVRGGVTEVATVPFHRDIPLYHDVASYLAVQEVAEHLRQHQTDEGHRNAISDVDLDILTLGAFLATKRGEPTLVLTMDGLLRDAVASFKDEARYLIKAFRQGKSIRHCGTLGRVARARGALYKKVSAMRLDAPDLLA